MCEKKRNKCSSWLAAFAGGQLPRLGQLLDTHEGAGSTEH